MLRAFHSLVAVPSLLVSRALKECSTVIAQRMDRLAPAPQWQNKGPQKETNMAATKTLAVSSAALVLAAFPRLGRSQPEPQSATNLPKAGLHHCFLPAKSILLLPKSRTWPTTILNLRNRGWYASLCAEDFLSVRIRATNSVTGVRVFLRQKLCPLRAASTGERCAAPPPRNPGPE